MVRHARDAPRTFSAMVRPKQSRSSAFFADGGHIARFVLLWEQLLTVCVDGAVDDGTIRGVIMIDLVDPSVRVFNVGVGAACMSVVFRKASGRAQPSAKQMVVAWERAECDAVVERKRGSGRKKNGKWSKVRIVRTDGPVIECEAYKNDGLYAEKSQQAMQRVR